LIASCAALIGCRDANLNHSSQSHLASVAAGTSYNWLQFNGSPQRSGNNTQETILNAATVSGLHQLFKVTLPNDTDNAPVLLTNVSTASGTHDLLFITTRAGDLLALDAHSGSSVWSKSHGAGSCRINNGSSPCFTPSAPVIDPGLAFVYTYGLDGFVHKHQVADGTEITSGGWPELATLKTADEKSSPGLAFATAASGKTFLYVGNGGNVGDRGDYQGHVTAINLADGSQHVFNTLCSNQTVHFTSGTPNCPAKQAAVWGRSPAVYDPDTDRIYFATGNGEFNPSSFNWGDTVLALHPDGTGGGGGNPLDTWTPTNFQTLDDNDTDLGSTEPAILPPVAGSRFPHLAAQSGKDAMLRLLNLDNLSGQGGPGNTGGELTLVKVPQGGGVLTAIATWTNPADHNVWIFVGSNSGLSGLRVTVDSSGNPGLSSAWQHSGRRTSPLIANNVLYAAGSNVIEALDPTTGSQLFSDTKIGTLHWESPMVANGVLYIADTSAHLTAYVSNTVAAPAITTQPTDQTVALGSAVTFSVRATGSAPLTFQWQRNGSNILAATSQDLTFTPVAADNGATFRCVVTNSAGSVTSNAAKLTVTTAQGPTITTQPTDQTVALGHSVTFSVRATGSAPLSFQWQRNGSNILAATSQDLTFNPVAADSGATFRCVVTNSVGSVTSNAAKLTVTVSACVTANAGDGFHNTPFAAQTSTFTVQFDATPSASPINSTMDLSHQAQTQHTGFATLARFNPSGNIDARDGGNYNSDNNIPYSGGTTYHFRLAVDIGAQTYSIFVTPAGGTEQTVGSNFAFRDEQSGVTTLDSWAVWAGSGSNTVCNFVVGP
jgi:hypothetical protein